MAATVIYTDQTGREVKLSFPPRRIVSLVPSQTELLFDLGLADEIIAVTKFCIHPVNDKPRIGGTKRLHLDEIKALAPDLIIANKEENEQVQVESLMQAFPVWVTDVHDLESALEMIRQVSTITDRVAKGVQLCAGIREAFGELAHLRNRQVPELSPLTAPYCSRLKVAYFIWKDPWMVAGGDTFISAMLEQCGWENVYKNRKRYPEISLEELMNTDCQLVLLSSEPFPFKTTHFPFFKHLPVRLVDGEMFSWYGSRILRAAAYFRENFYQNQDFF